MEIEKGLWFEYSEFIYGIKAPEEKFQELWDEVKENGGTNIDEDSRIFWLHHDWDSLNGWWIGDQDNPKGLVIGSELYYFGIEEMTDDNINPELLQTALENIKEYWNDFGQINEVSSLLEIDAEPTLHLVTMRYFLSKQEIEMKYKEFPDIYPQYKDYLEADTWEIREVK